MALRVPDSIMFDPSQPPAASKLDDRTRRKSSQVRVVTRIRPLIKDEARSQTSIYPVIVTKEPETSVLPEKSEKILSASDRGLLSRLSPQRRRVSSPPCLLSPSRGSSVQHSEHVSSIRGHVRQKSVSLAYSLIAGTENRTRFDFDAVLGPEASQKEAYERSVGDSIRRNVMRGVNTTIIAVGQDGSGKSHTMSGGWKTERMPKKSEGSISLVTEDDGILPRAVYDLFKAKQRQSLAGDVIVTMSFAEISNEGMEDLLATGSSTPLDKHQNKGSSNMIKETCSWIKVDSAAGVKALMDEASKKRRKKRRSSPRTHLFCCFQIMTKVHAIAKSENEKPVQLENSMRLTFINLAGPETPQDIDSRFQEDTLHKSTSYELQDILHSLTGNGENVASSPDAKLALRKMLADALVGKCFTLVIACVSPAASKVELSLEILRLSAMATKATIDIKPMIYLAHALTPVQCAALMAENNTLKAKVHVLTKRITQEPEKQDDRSVKQGDMMSDLQRTMKQAEEAAKSARESSQSFAAAADRWRNNRRLGHRVKASPTKGTESASCTPERRAPSPSQHMKPANEISNTSEKEDKNIGESETHRGELQDQDNSLPRDTKELHADYISLQSNFAILEIQLREKTRQLAEERLVTRELESLRESFKKRALLQNERVRILNEKLQYYAEASESLHEELSGMRFILSGERKLRDQAVETQMTVENNYRDLSYELSTLKLCPALQLNEIDKGKSNEENTQSSSRISKTSTCADQDKALRLIGPSGSPPQSTCKLPGISNDFGVSEASIYYDAEDDVSQVCSLDAGLVEPLLCKGSWSENKHQTQQVRVNCTENAVPKSEKSLKTTNSSDASSSASGNRSSQTDSEHIVGAGADEQIQELMPRCSCQMPFFSPESIQHVGFYLPKLDVACVCGKQQAIPEDEDIGDLRTILRPWQAGFLESIGITRTADFVKMHNSEEESLAKLMRQWRKEKKLSKMKTSSCSIALLIWSRTCKAVFRFYRSQRTADAHLATQPVFLEYASVDSGCVSSLGFGSTIIDSNRREI